MIYMRKHLFYVIAAVSCLAASCQKELTPEPAGGTVTLTARVESELTKTYLNGSNYVCWADGDKVWINGAEYTVSVSGSTATIAGVAEASAYACVYPSSIVSSFSDGCKVKLNLPSSQTITFDASGRQVLSLPMAAYGDGAEALEFKNLCGLMAVTLSNTDKSDGLTPTKITLSTSDGDRQMTASLYGETWAARDLSSSDYDNDWAICASNIGNATSSQKWTMNVSITGSPVIAQGASRTYCVTVPVIDDGTRSKIGVEMSGTIGGNNFLFSKKTSGSVKTIGRNQLGSIPVSSALCYEIKTSGTDWNGSGTEADPYQISCVDQWNHLAQLVFDKDKSITADTHFLQVCDIDCGGTVIRPVGSSFQFYSTKGHYNTYKPFVSTYDGGGHTISNFGLYTWTHGSSELESFGLFSYVDGAVIKNLNVKTDLYWSKPFWGRYAGGIIGDATKGTYSNLSYVGNLTVDGDEAYFYVGGVVGSVQCDVIQDLSFSGTVKVINNGEDDTYGISIGGVVGEFSAKSASNLQTTNGSKVIYTETAETTHTSETYAEIGGVSGYLHADSSRDIVNRADVSYTSDGLPVCAGGIAGSVYSSTLSNLVNEGDVTVSATDYIYAGGILGYHTGNEDAGLLDSCTNNGSVSATSEDEVHAGGCIGRLNGYILRINKFRNNGSVSAVSTDDNAYGGGVIGSDDDGSKQCILAMYNCENRGSVAVSGDDSGNAGGGLLGYHDSDGHDDKYPCIINCCNRAPVIVSGGSSCLGGLIGYCYNYKTTIGASFAVADLYTNDDDDDDMEYGGISGTNYTHVSNWWKIAPASSLASVYLRPNYAYPDAGTHYQASEDVSGLVSNLNGAWSGAINAVSGSVPSGYTPSQVTWKVDGDYPALNF